MSGLRSGNTNIRLYEAATQCGGNKEAHTALSVHIQSSTGVWKVRFFFERYSHYKVSVK